MQNNEVNIWESVSDLMTGMMMIFLFISLAFMLEMTMITENFYSVKSQIVADLTKEFPPHELEAMHAEIDPKDGTISFTADGTALFDVRAEQPSMEYRKILNNFFPRYINILSQEKYKGQIAEIRIEGHASVEATENRDDQRTYFYNMSLSQNRARNVMEYVMRMPIYQEKVYQDWLKKYITANGYSFSKSSGDAQKDRRVDFRVMLHTEETLEKVHNELSYTGQ